MQPFVLMVRESRWSSAVNTLPVVGSAKRG